MKQRITWTQEAHRIRGEAGGLDLFSIGYGTQRTETMWYLDTRLPISSPALGQKYADQEAAKVGAERLLTSFIRRIEGGAG